jgi:hypothetical protein
LQRFIRIKRRNQTYGFLCDLSSDTVLDLKEKIVEAVNQFSSSENDNENVTADSIRLLLPDQSTILEDSNLLQEYEDDLKNSKKSQQQRGSSSTAPPPPPSSSSQFDALLYLIFKVTDDDEYEAIDIISTEMEDAM